MPRPMPPPPALETALDGAWPRPAPCSDALPPAADEMRPSDEMRACSLPCAPGDAGLPTTLPLPATRPPVAEVMPLADDGGSFAEADWPMPGCRLLVRAICPQPMPLARCCSTPA